MSMERSLSDCIKTIGSAIENKKGSNTVVLDVRSICQLTDFFVFAEGNVGIHVKSISDSIIEDLKKEHLAPLYVEGMTLGDWVVIDYGFIIVHIFVSSIRDKYRLEELWKDGSIIQWDSLTS